jgi:rod shape-determining protein MreD
MSYIAVASIKPNLPVILTASFALMCGSKTGMIIGFSTGILLDLFGGGTLGFYALIYTWIGYAAGYTYRIFYDDDIKTPLL